MSKPIKLLSELWPPFAVLVGELIINCRERGQEYEVLETYRTDDRQQEMYRTGKSKVKSRGMHGFRLAVDFAAVVGGKITWDTKRYQILGEEAKKLGLTWGGDWGWDSGHVQLLPEKIDGQNTLPKLRKGWYPKPEDYGFKPKESEAVRKWRELDTGLQPYPELLEILHKLRRLVKIE